VVDSDILAANPRPAGTVWPGVEMKKAAVVNANSALEEHGNLKSEFIHLLERQTGDGYVGGVAASMFAIGDAAYLLVMLGAAITVMDDDWLACQGAQLLKAVDQRGVDLKLAAAVAGQLGLRKMCAQVAQGIVPSYLGDHRPEAGRWL